MTRANLIGIVIAFIVAGCAASAMAPLAVKWGADLISATSQNYSQQYSKQVEGLLLAVYSDEASKRLEARRAKAGQQMAGGPYPGLKGGMPGQQGQPYPGDQGAIYGATPGYTGPAPYEQAPYGSAPGYGSQSPYGSPPAAAGAYPPQGQPPNYGGYAGAPQQPGYPSPTQPDPYSQQQGGYPPQGAYPQTQGAYPQPQGAYPQEQGAYPPAGTQPPYGGYPGAQPGGYGAAPGGAPQGAQAGYGQMSSIVMDAAILAQRAADRSARRLEPVPIQDGEVLRDGGSDPRKGDVVKFSFRTNCDCYVYVIGVDATGYVARVFPDPASRQANPVRANEQYVVPEGTAWYGLDQYKGTEQVMFIASRQPRQDIESSLTQLAQTSRTGLARSYRPVREVALPDALSRGLVKVQLDVQNLVRDQLGQQYSFASQAFAAPAGADDIAITRWFKHE